MFRRGNIFCSLFSIFILANVLTGCSADSQILGTQPAEAMSSYAGPGPMRGSTGAYVLGPGDRLTVKVYSDPDMSGDYEINSAGAVAMPLVGDVKASGMTTKQLERAISAKMRGRVAKDPDVSISVSAYAPFYVYGEVKKPGEFPYRIGLTVADAVATAGGLTYRANEQKILLRRAGSSAEQLTSLDVPVKIYPGDNIRVSERMF